MILQVPIPGGPELIIIFLVLILNVAFLAVPALIAVLVYRWWTDDGDEAGKRRERRERRETASEASGEGRPASSADAEVAELRERVAKLEARVGERSARDDADR